MFKRSYLLIPLAVVLLLCSQAPLMAQGTQAVFGKNRVQYKDFTWSYFESDNFVTYYYPGGQDLAKFAVTFAEEELVNIEEKLEYKVSKRIHIMVYNDLSDMNQTNIGSGRQQNTVNTGGTTKIIDNKLFVHFNGDHEDMKRQIREGIAKIYLNHMMFGSNIQEILQNAVLLNLPEWFTEGLVSYLGTPWSVAMDNRLREGILSGRYEDFSKLRGSDAKFAGHALWHYVEEKYGRAAVPNLLYITRINRSLESGFLFVLGGSVRNISDEWYRFYYDHYTKEAESFEAPNEEDLIDRKPFKRRCHHSLRISPDGNKIAFATDVMGQYKVYVKDLETGDRKRILKAGIKTQTLVTNFQYPQIDFSPDNKTLVVIYEKRDQLKMLQYDLETGEKIKEDINKFQQIHSFRFMDDPRYIVMSGINRGQSDIYTYYLPSTRTQQITNDYHDDIYPTYVDLNGTKGIIWASNRDSDTLRTEKLDTIMPGGQYDLFFYNTETGDKIVTRVTNTPDWNEAEPLQYNDDHYAFISEKNGIKNRFAGYFETRLASYDTTVYFQDSIVRTPTWNVQEKLAEPDNRIDSVKAEPVYTLQGVNFPNSNYNSNILDYDMAPEVDKAAMMFQEDGIFNFYVEELKQDISESTAPKLENTYYRNYYNNWAAEQRKKLQKQQQEAQKAKMKAQQGDTTEPQKNYFFQSDFNTAPDVNVNETEYYADYYVDEPTFLINKTLPYKLKFSTDYVTTAVDNSLIMTRYEKFTPGQPVFGNPPLGGTINLGVTDLFEDIWLTGGFRFPFDFQGSEYWIAYENRRNRLDRKVLYYRKVEQESYSDVVPFYNEPINNPFDLPVEAKVKTNYFEYTMSYPIDVLRRFEFGLAYRQDNYVFQATDDFSLNLDNYNENWIFARVEFVHDNTIMLGKNLPSGIRFKAYAEIHKQFTIEDDTLFNSLELKLPNFDDSYFGVLGFDFRYYQQIHKNLIWANRVAYGTSWGTRKLIYYLGGVDSWIGAQYNNETPIAQDEDYAFQTIATNMRGFKQNVRNGSSFILFNSEIRFPIFSYLVKGPLRSEFLRNFQIVGFTDIGTAWEGPSPYSDENPLFTDEIGQPPVTVNVEYYKNPIVFGYGFGVRASLFGYFVRLDMAWGNDSGIKTDGPRLYFSFSTDF